MLFDSLDKIKRNSIFYKADILADLKKDYLESQAASRERFADDIKRGIFHRLFDSILRVAAPLL